MSINDHPNWETINTFTKSIITTIKNKQSEYFTINKKFFQGSKIPSIKSDGLSLAAINYGTHPSDQEDSWFTFSPNNFKAEVKFPVNVSIDVYSSPRGLGWILIIELWQKGIGPDKYGVDGDHWRYRHNEGPENFSGVFNDWHIVKDEVEPE